MKTPHQKSNTQKKDQKGAQGRAAGKENKPPAKEKRKNQYELSDNDVDLDLDDDGDE